MKTMIINSEKNMYLITIIRFALESYDCYMSPVEQTYFSCIKYDDEMYYRHVSVHFRVSQTHEIVVQQNEFLIFYSVKIILSNSHYVLLLE